MLTVSLVWGRVSRPWGFEVRADYLDEAGRLYHEVLTFPAQPDATAEAVAVESRRTQLEADLTPPPSTYLILCEDGTEVRL